MYKGRFGKPVFGIRNNKLHFDNLIKFSNFIPCISDMHTENQFLYLYFSLCVFFCCSLNMLTACSLTPCSSSDELDLHSKDCRTRLEYFFTTHPVKLLTET